MLLPVLRPLMLLNILVYAQVIGDVVKGAQFDCLPDLGIPMAYLKIQKYNHRSQYHKKEGAWDAYYERKPFLASVHLGRGECSINAKVWSWREVGLCFNKTLNDR